MNSMDTINAIERKRKHMHTRTYVVTSTLVVGCLAGFMALSACSAGNLQTSKSALQEVQAVATPGTIPANTPQIQVVSAVKPVVQDIADTIPFGQTVLSLLGLLAAAGISVISVLQKQKSDNKNSVALLAHKAAIRELLSTNPTVDTTKLSPVSQKVIGSSKLE